MTCQPTLSHFVDARSQFIALGVGGIVGRCGAHSAVSSLSPPLLSLIGRDWVAFPARHVVVDLGDDDTAVNGYWTTHVFVEFSVSPTMGVVDRPAAVSDFGRNRACTFHGWVGPKSAGNRFPLLVYVDPQGAMSIEVIDRRPSSTSSNNSSSSSNCVATVMQRGSAGATWAANGRWVVMVQKGSGSESMKLWDFGGIQAGRVAASCEFPLPGKVVSLAFLGGGSLAVKLASRSVAVIDLIETMEWKELSVTRQFTVPLDAGRPWCPMWCWGGKVFSTTYRNDHIVCVTTGERAAIKPPPGPIGTSCQVEPIGGPYFTVSEVGKSTPRRVFSVIEPPQVCHGYGCGVLFGAELALQSSEGEIQVMDAPSGRVILKMATPKYYVHSVSS
ncbi:hypothetical protein Pelo_7874 [Pelomyxa schiedti]|nr:hypothetical protein Pelo_7874 [Pelomyxa schiedti]